MSKPDNTALWQMYSTARAESLSAQQMMHSVIYWSMTAASVLIAAVTFLRQAPELTLLPWAVALVSWLTFFVVGMLGGTQYISEAGRMMRAGYYARLVETELALRGAETPPAVEMWEHYLTRKGNRLLAAYRVSGAAVVLALAAAQMVPFVVYMDHGPLDPGWWMLFPIIGTLVVFLSVALQYRVYNRRFPPE
ncbi:MAG: hypothetical protein WC971_04970 [Coriobacteriia bacterium]